MRGIYPQTISRSDKVRFNPARAGNIDNLTFPISVKKVQPRPCGEYLVVQDWKDNFVGSTPPVRGIYHEAPYHTDQHRFNPARAGNIGASGKSLAILQVQPRPCGEYVVAWQLQT